MYSYTYSLYVSGSYTIPIYPSILTLASPGFLLYMISAFTNESAMRVSLAAFNRAEILFRINKAYIHCMIQQSFTKRTGIMEFNNAVVFFIFYIIVFKIIDIYLSFVNFIPFFFFILLVLVFRCDGVDSMVAFVHIEGKMEKIDAFCGAAPPRPIMSNGARLLLEFRGVQSSRQAKGFKATYLFTESK